MMHSFGNLEKFGVSRLVFKGLLQNLEEAKARASESAEQELGAEKEEKSRKTREEWKHLREQIDETGEAEAYVDTFKKSQDLAYFMSFVELEMSTDSPEGFFNFENWLDMATNNPEELVNYFDNEPDIPIPRGAGGRAFIDGLTKPKESEEYKKSYAALAEIVAFLKHMFEKKRTATADIQTQAQETFKGPLTGTVKDGIETLSKNWERATGKEKLAIGAAGLIALAVIWKYKDKKFFIGENTTYQDVFMVIGAGLGLNYLAGKMSKDGKTPLQRLDIGRSVDDLREDNVMRGFCEKYKLAGNEEKMKAFYLLQQLSVKELFAAYEDASGPMGAREIDPTQLGFYKKEIDGKTAYELIEQLVRMTSVNEHVRQRREEARDKKEKYNPPNPDERKQWEENRYGAIAAFRNKYIYGEFGDLHVTLFDAYMNEYHTTGVQEAVRTGAAIEEFYREDVKTGKQDRLPETVVREAGKAATTAKKGVEKWAKDEETLGGKWIYNGIAGGLAVARDYTIKPAWEFLKREAKPILTTAEVWAQKGQLENVLPADQFAIEITEPEKARIMGYPGIPYHTEWSAKKATVDGIEFDGTKGIDGNKREALHLATGIQAKVAALLDEKNIAVLKGKKPEWNSLRKEWSVQGVNVKGEPQLEIPAGQTDISFTLQGEKPEIKFNIDGRNFEDFDDLDLSHRNSKIQEMLYTEVPALQGLPIQIDEKLETSPRVIIQGKIAGIPFQAVPHPFQVPRKGISLRFLVNGIEGGAELIKLDYRFAKQAAEFIGSTPEFQTPFFHLEAVMDNTKQDVWNRIKDAFPWNAPAAVNGKILNRHWKYLVDYKKQEILENFARELGNGTYTLDKISAVKTAKIAENLAALEDLAHRIESAANKEEIADKFPDYFAELETVNCANPQVRELFKEYKEMFWNDRFNYEGVETFGDLATKGWGGVADSAYQIYQVLMRVWNYHLRGVADAPSLSPERQNAIRLEVTARVKEQLEITMQKGDGTILLKNLPAYETYEDLERWLSPGYRTGKETSAQRIANTTGEIKGGITTPLPEHREKRDLGGSINPTQQNLDGLEDDDGSQPEHGIRKKLQRIYNEIFPLSYSFKFSNEVSKQYQNVLKLLPEAMLMDAITSNGSEEELLEQFEDKLTELRDKNESTAPWHEVWNVLKDIFRWLISDKSWDLPGNNPHIGKGPIKPNHKTFIANEMQKLEEYYRERLEDEHEYDSDAVDFLNEIGIPFSREYTLNKAVVDGINPTDMAYNYSNLLQDRFRECIKDNAERLKQETEDNKEKEKRRSNPKWTGPVEAMEEHIKS